MLCPGAVSVAQQRFRERVMNSVLEQVAISGMMNERGEDLQEDHSHLLLCCHKCIFNERAPLTPPQSTAIPYGCRDPNIFKRNGSVAQKPAHTEM